MNNIVREELEELYQDVKRIMEEHKPARHWNHFLLHMYYSEKQPGYDLASVEMDPAIVLQVAELVRKDHPQLRRDARIETLDRLRKKELRSGHREPNSEDET